MIIVEDKLEAIFSYLPDMSYAAGSLKFKPVFKYGDQYELNTFLKVTEDTNSSPYPLIWLLYPYKEDHYLREVKLENLTLILAVNTSVSMLNTERMETTFKKVLIPLFDNIDTAFSRAINTNVNEKVEVVKFPNYSDDDSTGEANFTNDRWDALKTIWSISINDACLKTIKI